MGHEQTSRHVRVMSVIPLKADIHQRGLHVRLKRADHFGLGTVVQEFLIMEIFFVSWSVVSSCRCSRRSEIF